MRNFQARRHPALALAALAAALLAVAGCGSSSSQSTSSSSSSAAAQSSSSSAPAGGTPVSKSAYEAKLGPLFNNQVDPALKQAVANGGLKDPQKAAEVVSILKGAHDQMAAVTPPTEIASIHQQAVTTLGSMATDADQLKTAENASDTARIQAAAQALKRDAQTLTQVGSELTAKGY